MRIPPISRSQAIVYLLLVAVLLGLAGKLLLGSPNADASGRAGPPALSAIVAESGEPAGTSAPLLVHVTGAVRRPGLYELREGSRVDDAIRGAGGPTRRAALDLVNLAAPVADGQQVVVPRRVGDAQAALPETPPVAAEAGPVRLNTATLEELDALPGVGPVTAQRILDYRTQHGAFQTVDELDAVAGIGPARLEQLRELVVL